MCLPLASHSAQFQCSPLKLSPFFSASAYLRQIDIVFARKAISSMQTYLQYMRLECLFMNCNENLFKSHFSSAIIQLIYELSKSSFVFDQQCLAV